MRTLRFTLSALIGVLIAFGIVVPAASILAPAVGRQVFAIRGQSMSPTIPMGAAIVVVERPVDELEAGDIVTWRASNGAYVTHRVIQVVEENGQPFVQTKGDANDSPDPSAVPADAIVGVVEAWVPVAGYALIMMSTPTGLVSWLSFGLALLATDALLAGAGAGTTDAPRSPASKPTPADRSARLEAVRRRIRGQKGTGWPIHFEGTTVLGDEISILEDMARCAEGDHRACATETARADVIAQRDGAGARK
jgi:signal peptidase